MPVPLGSGSSALKPAFLSSSCLSFSDGAKISHMHPRNSRNIPVKTRYFLTFCFCFNLSVSVLMTLPVELVKKLFHLPYPPFGEGIGRNKFRNVKRLYPDDLPSGILTPDVINRRRN